MYLRGFDRRGCSAAITNSSSSGFNVSGVFSDIADFVVLMLFDADDLFGHLYTTKYLPDFDLTGVIVDFDVAITNGMYPGSLKFPSVPWNAVSFLDTSNTLHSVPLNITSTSGLANALVTFTVVGSTPSIFDRVQLIYLGDTVFEYIVPGSHSVTMSYFGGTPLKVHSIKIGTNTYSYTESALGDPSNTVAINLAAVVNAGAGDTNGLATAVTNTIVVTANANTGITVVVGDAGTDGNGTGTLWVANSPTNFIAKNLATQINAATSSTVPLTATFTGATFTVTATVPGFDGNTIELMEIHKTSTLELSPSGNVKLASGADPSSFHVTIDFSSHPLIRQCWLTLAPNLPIDYTTTPTRTLEPFVPKEFLYKFSSLSITDPGSKTPLRVAGLDSIVCDSSNAQYAGSWTQASGFYHWGFAKYSSTAGSSVMIRYTCGVSHDLYLGTSLNSGGGTFSVTLDGSPLPDIDTFLNVGTPLQTRRVVTSGVAAGTHVLVLTVKFSGVTCFFDFLHAVSPSDVQDPATTYPDIGAAFDYDTDQTYKLSPQRSIWVARKAGFLGDLDLYSGVFFALKRIRLGGSFHQTVATLTGAFSWGTGFADGDGISCTVSGITFNVVVYPADTLVTIAQRFVNGINSMFVGIWADVDAVTPGKFAITSLTPINGFTITFSYTPSSPSWSSTHAYGIGDWVISGGHLYQGLMAANTNNTPASSPTWWQDFGVIGSITSAGDVLAGNEGTWQVDSSQSSPINRAFSDFLGNFCAELLANSMTCTVAWSQELLNPPDDNTTSGAWVQRFSDGSLVLTSTGFGTWGAGFVEANSGGNIQQTGHGYSTGFIVNIASGSGSGSWVITVTDADSYSLTAELANSGSYTPTAGDSTSAELQTVQCAFNPSTVTPYMQNVYLQTASIMSSASATPSLQLGEIGHWFFSKPTVYAGSIVNSLAISGFADSSGLVEVQTPVAHGFSTGQTAILAGTGIVDGTLTITVVDGTHFTVNGSSWPGGSPGAIGTVSGGGMAYYDANQTAAASSSLGHALGAFFTQDDDPSLVNSGADATFLAGRVKAHTDTIIAAVLTTYGTAKFELLFPFDVDFYTCYYTDILPFPQGGRMNFAVNLPSGWKTKSGSGFDRFKIEGLSWGATFRNLENAKVTAQYPYAGLSWPKSDMRYLIPWFNGGCPWRSEFTFNNRVGTPFLNFWAFDHFVLLSWEVPLKQVFPRSNAHVKNKVSTSARPRVVQVR
jgi:hypothetical protein